MVDEPRLETSLHPIQQLTIGHLQSFSIGQVQLSCIGKPLMDARHDFVMVRLQPSGCANAKLYRLIFACRKGKKKKNRCQTQPSASRPCSFHHKKKKKKKSPASPPVHAMARCSLAYPCSRRWAHSLGVAKSRITCHVTRAAEHERSNERQLGCPALAPPAPFCSLPRDELGRDGAPQS